MLWIDLSGNAICPCLVMCYGQRQDAMTGSAQKFLGLSCGVCAGCAARQDHQRTLCTCSVVLATHAEGCCCMCRQLRRGACADDARGGGEGAGRGSALPHRRRRQCRGGTLFKAQVQYRVCARFYGACCFHLERHHPRTSVADMRLVAPCASGCTAGQVSLQLPFKCSLGCL